MKHRLLVICIIGLFPVVFTVAAIVTKPIVTATTNPLKTSTIITKPASSVATSTVIITPTVTSEVTYDDPPADINPAVTLVVGGDEASTTLDYDASTTIEWTSENVEECTAPYRGDIPNYGKPLTSITSGMIDVSHIIKSGTFFINCKHPSGLFVTSSIFVNVEKQQAPTVTIMADGSEENTDITYGASTTISWDSTNTSTSSCTLSSHEASSTGMTKEENKKEVLPSGQESSNALLSSKVFMVSCKNDSGVATSSVAVNVIPSSQQNETAVTNDTTASCVTLTKNIRYGSRDNDTEDEVSTLQTFLSDHDFYKNEVSGFDGIGTTLAVKHFQKKEGLPATGFVGRMTREKIKEISCNTI